MPLPDEYVFVCCVCTYSVTVCTYSVTVCCVCTCVTLCVMRGWLCNALSFVTSLDC